MNLTFLKKLGQGVAQAVIFATGLEPLIAPFLGARANTTVGKAVNDLTAIAQQIVSVEAILQGPGRGAEKLAASVPLIAGIIRTSEFVAGKHVVDEATFIQGCEKIAGGLADVLNSLANKVDTTDGPLPVPAPPAPAPAS
jgi:hypothetical protein